MQDDTTSGSNNADSPTPQNDYHWFHVVLVHFIVPPTATIIDLLRRCWRSDNPMERVSILLFLGVFFIGVSSVFYLLMGV